MLLALPLLVGCATYSAEFAGERVKLTATTEGPEFTATGENMTGAIKRDGAEIASTGEPITGTIRWKRGEGWSVESR